MTDLLTRRRFIAALAASVVAVGAPLPIGFPREPSSSINLTQQHMFEELEYTMAYITDNPYYRLQLSTSEHKYNDEP